MAKRIILFLWLTAGMWATMEGCAWGQTGGYNHRRARREAKKAVLPVLSDNERLQYAVLREAERQRVDPLLIWALVAQESGGKVAAVSYKGARGPMQLMPGTAARFGVKNPHHIEEAVRGGTEYLVWLFDLFGGDVSLGLAGYNAGEGAVLRYGRRIPPYAETREYVRRISERYEELKKQVAQGQKIFTVKDAPLPKEENKEQIISVKPASGTAGDAPALPLKIRMP
jgi:soluble lytic murein transglycosylase-like protein